jgi:hypothetical protein
MKGACNKFEKQALEHTARPFEQCNTANFLVHIFSIEEAGLLRPWPTFHVLFRFNLHIQNPKQ